MVNILIFILLIISISFGFELRSGDKEQEYRIVLQMKNNNTDFDIFQINRIVIVKVNEPLDINKIKRLEGTPVEQIEIYQTEDRSKSIIYIEMITSIPVKTSSLDNPKRLVIDIKKVSVNLNVDIKPSIVKSKQNLQNNNNLDYVDLDKILATISNEKVDDKTIEIELSAYKNYKGKKRVIVIDPGHGGQDPGAMANGLREKDINLKIAKMLKSYFDKDPRFIAYLTRDDDTYIPLYDRTLIALEKKADLFISIHTNASENPNLSGTYVYTLNLRGATSKLARMVEERENKTVLNVVKVSANPNVNKIVADMAISHTMTEGLNFAKFVELNYKNLIKDTEFKRIESANFAVLKTPSIPSILFETAFITNEKDAQLLKDDRFLDKVAKTLYKSTSDYFFKYKNLVFKENR
ncbi:MAG: N-acetylmuramoyl-L-alanine amidase [Hydrogenothermaceae bacterium]